MVFSGHMEIYADGSGIPAIWRYLLKIVVFRRYWDINKWWWFSGHMEIPADYVFFHAIWRFQKKMVAFRPYGDI